MIRIPIIPGSKFKLIECEANKGKGMYAASEGFVAYPDSLCHIKPHTHCETARLLVTKSGKKGKLRLTPMHMYVSTFLDEIMLEDVVNYNAVFGSSITLAIENKPMNLLGASSFEFLAWSYVYNDYLNLLLMYAGGKLGDIIPNKANRLKELQNLQARYEDHPEAVLNKADDPEFRVGIIENIRSIEKRVFKIILPTRLPRGSARESATALLQAYNKGGVNEKYKERLNAFIESLDVKK